MKVEDEDQLTRMLYATAQFLGVDVTMVDRSVAAILCFQIGQIWMESVKEVAAPRRKRFWVYVKPGRRQWLQNLSLKEAGEQATEDEKRRVIDGMMRRVHERWEQLTPIDIAEEGMEQ